MMCVCVCVSFVVLAVVDILPKCCESPSVLFRRKRLLPGKHRGRVSHD